MNLVDTVAVRTLVVDDDDVDREKTVRILQKTGLVIEAVEAANGAAAMQLLTEQRFDLVILDHRLGDCFGLDLVGRIRDAPWGPCPIILVTGYGDERLAVEAMRDGACDYYSKSQVSAATLKSAIEAALRWSEVARQLADAQDRLHRLSFFDVLTGLPNRTLFFERLEQAMAESRRVGSRFAIAVLDLEMFKEVNDALGHAAGDAVLSQVSLRLQALGRLTDTIARIGGDEFACILTDTSSEAGIAAFDSSVRAVMGEAFGVAGQAISIGVATGTAMFPDHGSDVTSLLAHADQVMNREKRSTHGVSPTDDEPPLSRSSHERAVFLPAQLTRALESGDLFLEYQPKIDLSTEEIVGLEALVRWRAPGGGVVPPYRFIGAAERTAVIYPLTREIFRMALDQAARWWRDGVRLGVAVNASVRVLDDPRFTLTVADELASRNLPPRILTIELTETALISSPLQARAALSELARLGVTISIDDFGTGFTSFRYLRDLDVGEIKIDRMFITDALRSRRDSAIIRSVAALARGFDVKIVAEGVEERAAWSELRRLGCTIGQGYSIARPMPADAVAPWVNAWRLRLRALEIADPGGF